MRIDHRSSVRLAAALLVMTLASSSIFTSAVSDTFNINHDSSSSSSSSLSHNQDSPLPLPQHIQQQLTHHQHQQLLKRHHPSSQPQQPHSILTKRAPSSPQAWVDYYTSTGAFIDESTLTSTICHSLPSSWGILDITAATRPNPANNERDVLQLFNDKNCISQNREPATQTGFVVIAMYFNKVPQSLMWTRISSGGGVSITTTTSTMTPNKPTSITTAVASSSSSTLSTSISSIPSPLATDLSPPDGTAILQQPPRHTSFPTALIPPKPQPDSSSSSAWGDNCGGPQNDPDSPGCKGARHVTHVLIVGITIAVVAVGLMAAGSFYIYRRFYASPLPSTNATGNSSSYRSNQHNNNNSSSYNHGGRGSGSYAFSGTHNMNSSVSGSGSGTASRSGGTGTGTGSGTGTGTGRRLGDDANPDYEYCHDEDENDDGSKPPRFMFDHRHDNINTNRNPRLFNEGNSSTLPPPPPPSSSVHYPNSSSDISLIERVRK